MATVENGVIKFSGKEAKTARGFCPGCKLNTICRGPDTKTDTAEIHNTISEDPTDVEILAQAACLVKTNV